MGDGDKGAPFSASNDFVFASFGGKVGKVLFWFIWNFNFSVKKCLNGMFFYRIEIVRTWMIFARGCHSTRHDMELRFFCSRDWEHNLERFLHNRLINLSFLLCCDRSVNWDLFIYSLLSCIAHHRTVQYVCVCLCYRRTQFTRGKPCYFVYFKGRKWQGNEEK